MSLPQLWNALGEGKTPKPGRRHFTSSAECRAYREALARGEDV